MNILVTGTRTPIVGNNERKRIIKRAFSDNIVSEGDGLLIHGAAPGIDSYVAAALAASGWRVCAHPADWQSYGKAAGPIRNQSMLTHHPDIELVLAFPDPESRGTWDMVERAVRQRIPVRVYLLP